MRELFCLACLFASAAVALPPAVDAGGFDMSQIYTIDSCLVDTSCGRKGLRPQVRRLCVLP